MRTPQSKTLAIYVNVIVRNSEICMCFAVAHASTKRSTVDSSMNATFHPIGAGVRAWSPKTENFTQFRNKKALQGVSVVLFLRHFHGLWEASC